MEMWMRDKIYLARMRGRPREWYAVRVEPWACRNATLDASPSDHSFHRSWVVAIYTKGDPKKREFRHNFFIS